MSNVIVKKSGRLCPRFEKDGVVYVKLPGPNGDWNYPMPLSEWEERWEYEDARLKKWIQENFSKKIEDEGLKNSKNKQQKTSTFTGLSFLCCFNRFKS